MFLLLHLASAGTYPDVHPGCTCGLQGVADLVGGRSGSQDIVYQDYVLSIEVSSARERAFQVALTVLCGEGRLLIGVAGFFQKRRTKRNPKRSADEPGNEDGLV